jgi:hypothetical protein
MPHCKASTVHRLMDMTWKSISRGVRYQGPRHTPRMHRRLQAYCATLNPPPPQNFGSSSFRRQVPPRPQDARDPSSERWNFVGENCRLISPTMSTSTLHVRDLLQAANLRHGTNGFTSPPKEGVLRIFFPPLKIRRLRPGLNPRT